MTKYVIGPDVAIRLARDQVAMGDEHQILAPALLRSQMLSLLYQAVHHGEMTKKDAERRLSSGEVQAVTPRTAGRSASSHLNRPDCTE